MKIQNLTEGKPLWVITRFAIPLIFTSLLQQLYNFADSAIIGQCLGVNAFSAVGVTGSVVWLIIGIAMGIAVGFSIPIAQSFGADDENGISSFFWNGLYLSVIISLTVGAFAFALSDVLLKMINTPPEIMNDSLAYVRVIFVGLPVTVLYNYFASVLRSFGDSKHPFYFLIASSVLNIILDPIFILAFNMGIAGAAWATVISQAFSAALCALWLFKKVKIIKTSQNGGSLTSFSGVRVKRLLRVGLPMAFEYSISSIGSLALQSSVNTLGLALGNHVIAGQAAGEKIRMIATLPMEGVGMAISTYAAQNVGANRMDRVKQGLKSGAVIQLSYCVFAYFALLLLKKPLSVALVGAAAQSTVAASCEYIGTISLFFCFHGLLMVFRNTLQGMGRSSFAVISGFCEVAGRVIGGRAAVGLSSFTLIGLTNPFCWLLAAVYCLCATVFFIKREEKGASLTLRKSKI